MLRYIRKHKISDIELVTWEKFVWLPC